MHELRYCRDFPNEGPIYFAQLAEHMEKAGHSYQNVNNVWFQLERAHDSPGHMQGRPSVKPPPSPPSESDQGQSQQDGSAASASNAEVTSQLPCATGCGSKRESPEKDLQPEPKRSREDKPSQPEGSILSAETHQRTVESIDEEADYCTSDNEETEPNAVVPLQGSTVTAEQDHDMEDIDGEPLSPQNLSLIHI